MGKPGGTTASLKSYQVCLSTKPMALICSTLKGLQSNAFQNHDAEALPHFAHVCQHTCSASPWLLAILLLSWMVGQQVGWSAGVPNWLTGWALLILVDC